MAESQEHTDSDIRLISSYNISGKLGGVGRSILLHAVHEMDDASDIQKFVCLCRWTGGVMLDELFPWSLAPGLTKSYSLRSVPVELTDIVFIFASYPSI